MWHDQSPGLSLVVPTRVRVVKSVFDVHVTDMVDGGPGHVILMAKSLWKFTLSHEGSQKLRTIGSARPN